MNGIFNVINLGGNFSQQNCQDFFVEFWEMGAPYFLGATLIEK